MASLKKALLYDPTIRAIFTCWSPRANFMIQYPKQKFGESAPKSEFLLMARGFSCDDGISCAVDNLHHGDLEACSDPCDVRRHHNVILESCRREGAIMT